MEIVSQYLTLAAAYLGAAVSFVAGVLTAIQTFEAGQGYVATIAGLIAGGGFAALVVLPWVENNRVAAAWNDNKGTFRFVQLNVGIGVALTFWATAVFGVLAGVASSAAIFVWLIFVRAVLTIFAEKVSEVVER